MRFSEASVPPIEAPAGVLDDDRPCLKCGYSLRGLAASGVCPECGTSVERSLAGNLLKYSDPAYVAGLHRGALVVELAIAGWIVLGVSLVYLGALGGWFERGLMAAAQTVSLGVSVASLVGWWMVTTPDPALLGEDRGATARKVLRASLVVGAVALLARSIHFGGGGLGSGVSTLMFVMGITSVIAWVVGYFASMVYIGGLGARVPDETLRSRPGLMMWLGPGLVAGGVLAGVVVSILPLALVVIIGVSIGWLVWVLLYVGLIDRLRMELKKVRSMQLSEG